LIILSFSFIIFKSGVEPVYFFNCSSPLGCELHPFQEFCHKPTFIEEIKYSGRFEWLQSCGLCDGGKVMQGVSCGSAPKSFQGSEGLIAIILCVLAFLINHFKYNKGKTIGGI